MSIRIANSKNEIIRSVAAGAYLLLVMLLLILLVGRVDAKTVSYGSTIEQVRIRHGGPTIFRFPKAVQTITGASRLEIKPANAADPSYTVLSVTPRFTNGVNEVSFFLTDGSVIKTKIMVSPNDPAADSVYDFKSHDALDSADAENAPPISEIDLLKAMIRDDVVSGYKVSKASESFPSKQGVSVELIRVYQGSLFNGYVFKLSNTNWIKNVDVDVRHVTVGDPNLAILSQCDDAVITAKGKGVHETFLRVVTKNTASSRDVILAMEAEDPTAQSSSKKGE